ncbi:MAG: L-threonine 3-dehydrogenase [Planctomycetia bacterium]|nr:L-threonine 3-dehydrogenase [Planctomycetia bacterium]
MLALVKAKKEKGIWLQEVPVPEVGPNDVLIKIHKTAICGTDIHIYNWDAWSQATIPVPMHVGHEFVGEIVSWGDNVEGYSVGEIVSGEGHIVCGRCRNCLAGRRHLCIDTHGVGVNRPGAFAQYLSIPSSNVWPCAPDIPEDIIACFDPFGNATHTALSFDLTGEDVLITGAGPIGIMAAAICRHVGARYVVVTDVNEYRLTLAAKMGATRVVNVAKENLQDVMKMLSMKEGFDIGLEMSGNASAFSTMIDVMHHGGKVALLGIPSQDVKIDWNKVVFNGLQLKGIYGREMYETWYKMTAMIQSGLDIMPVITHRYDIRDYQEAFEVMASGRSGKVVMDWTKLS